jgi:hypothetical protein
MADATRYREEEEEKNATAAATGATSNARHEIRGPFTHLTVSGQANITVSSCATDPSCQRITSTKPVKLERESNHDGGGSVTLLVRSENSGSNIN